MRKWYGLYNKVEYDKSKYEELPCLITLLDNETAMRLKRIQNTPSFATYIVTSCIARFDDLKLRWDMAQSLMGISVPLVALPYPVKEEIYWRNSHANNVRGWRYSRSGYWLDHGDIPNIATLPSPDDGWEAPNWTALTQNITELNEQPLSEYQQMRIVRNASTSAQRGEIWRKLTAQQRTAHNFLRAYVAAGLPESARISFQSLHEACEALVVAAESIAAEYQSLRAQLPSQSEVDHAVHDYTINLLETHARFADSTYARFKTKCRHCDKNLLLTSHAANHEKAWFDLSDNAEYDLATPLKLLRGDGVCNRPGCPNPLLPEAYAQNLAKQADVQLASDKKARDNFIERGKELELATPGNSVWLQCVHRDKKGQWHIAGCGSHPVVFVSLPEPPDEQRIWVTSAELTDDSIAIYGYRNRQR